MNHCQLHACETLVENLVALSDSDNLNEVTLQSQSLPAYHGKKRLKTFIRPSKMSHHIT